MEKLHHDLIKLKLSEILHEAIEPLKEGITVDFLYEQIEIPADINFGHYTYSCFFLAKDLKRSPAMIANEINALILKNKNIALESSEVVGPYINFKLSNTFLGEVVLKRILNNEIFSEKLLENTPKTMIEYSQPNTHKELHVGHMRNMCLGDALIKLHQYCGYEIISSTFPGDIGTHVAKCLWYYKYHNTEKIPEENKGAWLGALYTKAHIKLDEEEGTELENNNKMQLSNILTQLEEQSGEFYEIWKETREWSINLMNEVYDWADIKFDKWYWESEVDLPSVELVKKYYNNGLFTISDGAVGCDLTEYNLGFCILLKSDGHGLYSTKDIELARRKFDDFKIQKSVYIVDKRQAHHFEQIFKILELMGFENAKNCYHLKYDYVELPNGAMSSRKGNIIPLLDLINQMKEKVRNNYLDKYTGIWSEKEIKDSTEIIAKGAIKYGMIKIDPGRKIVFDMEDWLKIDVDSGTYLQYTGARINSLVAKLKSEIFNEPDWSKLEEDIEKQLMIKLSKFNNELLFATLEYKPNYLANYLYELCKMFNNFYNILSIKNTQDNVLKSTRFYLAKCTGIIIEKGLNLLGISIPEKM